MEQLKQAMLQLIANDAPMKPQWLHHTSKRRRADHRDCHIDGDFPLIYQVEANAFKLVRCGTHAD